MAVLRLVNTFTVTKLFTMTYLPGENPKIKSLKTVLEQVRTLLACPKLDRGSLMLTGTDADSRTHNSLIVWGSTFTPAPKTLLRNFLESYAAELEAQIYMLGDFSNKTTTKRDEDIKRISENLRWAGRRIIAEQIYKAKPGKFERFRDFADMDFEETREELIALAYDEKIPLTY